MSFRVLHFNDVYKLESRKVEPVGGAARFCSLVKQERQTPGLVLFSGDVFNPSLESTVTKGRHMVPVLNQLGIDLAMFGNHDFDFGVEMLGTLAASCNFPFLLSNLVDKDTHDGTYASSKKFVVVEREGIKIGVIGLVEKEWIETLPFPPSGLKYIDFVEAGRQLARDLQREGVDVIIALTHMREPNDVLLAESVPELDLVLGGHDHFQAVHRVARSKPAADRDFVSGGNDSVAEVAVSVSKQDNSTEAKAEVDCKNGDDDVVVVVKSGTEFRNLSVIDISMESIMSRRRKQRSDSIVGQNSTATRWSPLRVDVRLLDVTAALEEDPAMKSIVAEQTETIGATMGKVVGHTLVDLDATTEGVRTRESNLGNFVCDVLRYFYDADVALIAGGTIRSDQVIPAGPITVKNILDTFPFEDSCVVARLLGKDLIDALENALSQYPKHEGRFPQVSGVAFSFDPRKPAGSRLLEVWHHPTGVDQKVPLDVDREYLVVTREYMAVKKGDGFGSLARGKLIVDAECGLMISTILRRYFTELKVINAFSWKESIVKEVVDILRHRLPHGSYKPRDYIIVAPKVEGRINMVR